MAEGDIIEELTNPKPVIKRRLRQKWTPALFAMFLIEHGAHLTFQDALYIRRKFPTLFAKCSDKVAIKRIEQLMNNPEFDKVAVPFLQKIANKSNTAKMFDTLVHKAYLTNMELPPTVQPSVKFMEMLGKVSGKLDITQKVHVTGLEKLTPDQEKKISDLVSDGLANRLNRLKALQEKEKGNNGAN
jgi:hypothetical protein